MMSVEARLRELGIEIPPVPTPAAMYVPAVQTGNLVYTSGQIPTRGGTLIARGQVGMEVSVDTATEACRVACLNALAAVQSLAGSLERVERVVRVTGYVSSAGGFTDQPTVVNGASNLLVELFGERGQHARSAIGVAELPLDAPVEIELIVELRAG